MSDPTLHVRPTGSAGVTAHQDDSLHRASTTRSDYFSSKNGESRIEFVDGSFDMLGEFVQYLMEERALDQHQRTLAPSIDWQAIRRAAADSPSVEQAIGRAAMIADRMTRGIRNTARGGIDIRGGKSGGPVLCLQRGRRSP